MDDHEARLKRITMRSWRRGTREMDLILGGFVTRNLDGFSEAEIADLERIMEIPDQDMLSWATRQAEIPPQHVSPLLIRILASAP